MAVGGIPYYLNLTAPGDSVAQTIDRLFFKKKSKLDDEFNRLSNSIFVKGEASRASSTQTGEYNRQG